ncbi:MAG: tRNA dihydrouridine synthase DusB [Clostridia bacterium]|nr:tRNA dihydrouridine synthase DusB [Clostridia bacterium]
MQIPPDSILLAPMAGITDYPFRLLCRRYGLTFGFTEMVSAKALCLAPDPGVLEPLLYIGEGENLAVQLFGSDPVTMGEAARRLSERPYRAIDINMGCPVRKIVGGGDGSALLRHPELAEQVARSVVRSTHLPVFVKMRLGWESGCEEGIELARRMEDSGVAMLTVHGRTRMQMYSGNASLEGIRRIRESVTVPVVGNGDIRTREDAEKMRRETGCDAVMVGRAALGNPFIIEELRGGETPSFARKIEVAMEHLHLSVEFKGERTAIPEMRKQISWYLHGMPGAARIREKIVHLEHENEVCDTLAAYREKLLEREK